MRQVFKTPLSFFRETLFFPSVCLEKGLKGSSFYFLIFCVRTLHTTLICQWILGDPFECIHFLYEPQFLHLPLLRLLLEDGLKCDYSNRTVRAKLMEICFKLEPLGKHNSCLFLLSLSYQLSGPLLWDTMKHLSDYQPCSLPIVFFHFCPFKYLKKKT